eukprot:scaffold529652_cov37-Prasinocladus_malaysianus.AAC.1
MMQELTPADILLQQYENHRMWEESTDLMLARYKAQARAAAGGRVDKTGRWVHGREPSRQRQPEGTRRPSPSLRGEERE